MIRLRSIFFIALATSATGLFLLTHFQSSLLYQRRKYSDHPWYYTDQILKNAKRPIQEISYALPDGSKQIAFFLDTLNSNDDRVWVMLGGNAQLALDWVGFTEKLPGSAFLLVDYPGFGKCDGPVRGSKDTVWAVRAAIAAAKLGKRSIGIVGHSLGAAVALAVAAEERGGLRVDRMVLVSPFVSIPEMAKAIFVPTGLRGVRAVDEVVNRLVFSENVWDNKASLSMWEANEVAANNAANSVGKKIQVHVIHGDDDEIVPFAQGKELFKHLQALEKTSGEAGPFRGRFRQILRGDHNNIMETAFHDVVSAMNSKL